MVGLPVGGMYGIDHGEDGDGRLDLPDPCDADRKAGQASYGRGRRTLVVFTSQAGGGQPYGPSESSRLVAVDSDGPIASPIIGAWIDGHPPTSDIRGHRLFDVIHRLVDLN